jgi:hypothetical protein
VWVDSPRPMLADVSPRRLEVFAGDCLYAQSITVQCEMTGCGQRGVAMIVYFLLIRCVDSRRARVPVQC